MKVGIFTTNSIDKIHPRIQMQTRILQEYKFNVEVIRSSTRREGVFFEFINWLSLKYFKKRAIHRFKKELYRFDIIHIYDFQLLPLAAHAKKLNKKVIYETLDDNVHLHFSAIEEKVKPIKIFKSSIIKFFSAFEKYQSEKYCDAVIVNSKNLQGNFKSSDLIYYSSFLESIPETKYDSSKVTKLLYVGKLTQSKGSIQYQGLVNAHNIGLIFLGKAFDQSANELCKHKDVIYLGNKDVEGLINEIKLLKERFNLIGLSIIHQPNKSYRLQEANKDIDYLSCGIPFIGNYRPTTAMKINMGCGTFYDMEEEINNLIGNVNGCYDSAVKKCVQIYSENYSQSIFKNKLLQTYNSLV